MDWYLITGILFAAAVIAAWMLHMENRRFKVTEYTIETDKITKDMTFAVLADLHNYKYGTDNEKLLQRIRRMRPDAVISAGDMIEAGENAKGTKETVRFLSRVSKEFPFYYGMGNHERKFVQEPDKYQKVRQEFFEAMEETGLSMIDNETVYLPERNVKITGLNLEKKYFRKVKMCPVSADHINKLAGKADPRRFHILIAHNPDQMEAYAKWGADLVLSGHVHGGMIVIPGIGGMISPQFTLFPKYDGGEYHMDKTTMLLSRGIGNHTVHVRIFNRAELLCVHLKKVPGQANRGSLEKI